MPAKSKAEIKYLFAAERRGEVKRGTARKMAEDTPNIRALPMHVGDRKKPARSNSSRLRPRTAGGYKRRVTRRG